MNYDITPQEVIDKADALYNKCRKADSYQLDLDKLVKEVHAKIIFETEEDIREAAHKYKGSYAGNVTSLLGFLYSQKDTKTSEFHHAIYINRNSLFLRGAQSRYRFTVAHEIGHILFDVRDNGQQQSYFFPRKKDSAEYTEEEQAREDVVNFFAANVLAPRRAMHDVLRPYVVDGQIVVDTAVRVLIENFNISETMARRRLKEVYA